MTAPNKKVSLWDLNDFMQFVSSVGIKGGNYDKIKKTMEDNSLSVSDIKGTPASIGSLFGLHEIIAKKIQKPLYKLRLNEGLNETINTNEHKQNNENLNNQSNNQQLNNQKFCVNFRSKQGKFLTLRRQFTAYEKVSSVVQAYQDEECANKSYKVEKIIFQSAGTTLQHEKTLKDYNIIDENNLITVIFKTKGGANFASRTVEEWTTDDLQNWIKTLNLDKDVEQNIIESIGDNGLTGEDLKNESCDDIAAVLNISNEAAKVLCDGFINWKVIEQTENVSDYDMKLNETDAKPDVTYKYYIGYKLDCKDQQGFWCPAEVINVNKDSSVITVKFLHWKNPKTPSGRWEDTIQCEEFETRLKEYGVITNKSSKAKAIKKDSHYKYSNNNSLVYKAKRHFHPTKNQAKQVRKAQAQQIKSCKKENESGTGGFMNTVASYIPGYNSYNSYNYYNSSVSGIIGLTNLGNQCYMNSAIQLVLQTPPLLKLFRSARNTSIRPLLKAFVDLCKAAMSSSSSYRPERIKSILLQQDYASFGDYSQQDASHALSTLLIKLDQELLDNKKCHSKSINCIRKNGLDSYMEEALVEQIMDEYNPNNKSVIRDTMTFIFRKEFSCLAPNCDYSEWRYSLTDKLVLPLENHCIIIPVQIFISNKVFVHEFNCLSYCSVSTLTAQIHDFLRNKNGNKQKTYDINLYSVQNGNQNNQLIDPTQLLKSISSNDKCNDLINRVVLVAARSINPTDNEMKQGMEIDIDEESNILMKQLCIELEQVSANGKNREKQTKYNFYLNVVPVKRGTNINDVPVPSVDKNVIRYYEGKIVPKNDILMANELNDSMVIVCNANTSFYDDGYDNVSSTWKFIGMDSTCKYKAIFDYNKIAQKLKLMLQARVGLNMQDEENKLNIAIECFDKMAHNQKRIAYYLKCALKSMNKCSKKFTKPLDNMDDCLDAYLAEQVLDGGARIKCTNCNDYCKVFKQQTKIVRYPSIVTILFDRFDDGRKYDHKINYNKTMKRFNPIEYGLYGVCNHTSSSTDYGHYYSYVKSVDKNASKWYTANDSSITAMTDERRITNNRNALVLMFEKK